MELATLDLEKARAHEAFARGQLGQALKMYDALEPAYVRYGFHDGLVALRYNRLLAAVEADERSVLLRAATTLAESLLAVQPPGSPTTLQVAEGILKLLPAAARGLDPETETLLYEAARAFTEARPAVTADAFPANGAADASPATVAHLHPEDAARLVLTHPSALLSAAMLSDEPAPGAIDEVIGALEAAWPAGEAGDRSAAYQALVGAFDRARHIAPGLAAEIQIGCLLLESEGLPERLEYTPGLPLERRLPASLDLHGRVARGLSREAGYEAAARRQWAHTIDCARRVTEKLHTRRVRGGGNAEDAEVEANAALWTSLAHRHLGAQGEAAAALTPCLSRAQRCAYANVTVSVRILLQAADLAEREGDTSRAHSLFTDAAELALVGATRFERTLDLANAIGEAIVESAADRLPFAAIAMAGLARTLPADPLRARRFLAQAADLLTLSRVYLPQPPVVGALLWVELSAARLGDAGAATRAFEIAAVLNEPLAGACALLHRAALSAQGEPDGRAAAPGLHSQAAQEASRGAAGEIRRAAEQAAALAWHEAGDSPNEGARVEVHLRRLAEASRTTDFPDGALDFDPCLPAARRAAVEPLHERLLTEGRTALLHQLTHAERRRVLDDRPSVRSRAVADALRDWHRRDFESRRRRGQGSPDFPSALAKQLATLGREGGTTAPALAHDEAVLSFRVQLGGTLAFVHRAGSAAPQAFRIAAGTTELQGQVTELLRVLRAGDEHRRELLLRAQEVFHLLIRPILGALGDVTALQIVPDGPLWSLPFAVLLGENFLCERFELSIARAAPTPETGARDEAPDAPPSLLVAGDHATSRDLRLSVLERDGLYGSIAVRTGEDLAEGRIADAFGQVRLVHLVGPLGAGPTIDLCEGAPPTPLDIVTEALRGALGAMLFGPVEGATGQKAVTSLLGGLRGGVFARHWAVDEDGEFLHELFRASASACSGRDLAMALAATRRAAIRARLPARLWAAYELYTHERD